ncbi:hypothetical protein D3C84_883780 [compost metagenome]
MAQNQHQGSEALLPIDHFIPALFGNAHNQWLQAIKIVRLRTTTLGKFANIFQQLRDLQLRPTVSTLISRNEIALGLSFIIQSKLVNGLQGNSLLAHSNRILPVSSSCNMPCLRARVLAIPPRSSSPWQYLAVSAADSRV